MFRNTIVFLSCLISFQAIAQSTIRIQAGTSLRLSSGVVVTFKDLDLVNNGDLNAATGNGRIIFSGNTNNRISGSSVTGFDELEIAKTNNRSLQLEQELQVRSGIWFTAGVIDLNAHNITLFGNAALQNESETSRITGINGGHVQLSIQLAGPQAVNPGNLGATITSLQNLGLTTIRRGHQSQTNGSGNGNSVFRYYDIIPSGNTALDATLRFQYWNSELNGLDENSLVFWKSDDNIKWTNEGYSSRDITTNYAEKTAIPSFYRWTLSSVGNPLPVTGLQFTGRWQNNAAQLNWTTLTEYNNRYFDIERKYSNENDFSVIGVKNSLHADGNSQSPSWYQFIDPAAANKGNISYRLKQVDKDGQFVYSKIILIKPPPLNIFIQQVYPTQKTGHQLYIQTGDLTPGEMYISIFDMQGRLCMKRKARYSPQWIKLPSLAAGIYQLVIESGEWKYFGKFIRE
ncbi:T9SS type A sorting domain-containing protein [Pseudobacter ginsenosidimutans]|uniref:Putative secreted protein (Por secretion system target) n=1 Tax=Pseudobacter ginsenosidimutans TaxID=661488 RepID=A0A4Q7N4W7_9BACT|nr:T9SS type A sorting domain-containing protein [Pseudobacter ginsenosidimutans]QEC44595.1 T9SS type A sorting domain-containing protein [Pseudobacter ginsenosidimutans]RZS76074.1 putative secreted protein (Por secretion system target) [Pseudobacter ginsenosidimutans]